MNHKKPICPTCNSLTVAYKNSDYCVKCQGDFEEFLSSYILAALWSSNDESTPEGGEPFDSNYDESDIDQDTMETMRHECEAFLKEAGDLISDDTCLRSGEPMNDGETYTAHELAGHDFWLTRCGHGVGFWEDDRWTEEAGEVLDQISKRAGNVDLYLGDDGRIYQ